MKVQEDIKQDVVDQLATDARVDASDVSVKVDDFVVTLEGTVPSFSAKQAARDVAFSVIGVAAVTNSLTVEFPTTLEVPSDDEVQQAIENLFILNGNIDENDITVEVDAGLVTLDGTVPSFWDKTLAEDEARGVIGVISVTNKLAVVPTEKVSDEIVGDRVMDRIENNTLANMDDVDATVRNGEVTLSGELPSYSVWREVYDATRFTLGVKNVVDNTTIAYA